MRTSVGKAKGLRRGGRLAALVLLAFATFVTGLSFKPVPAEAQVVIERRYRSPGLLDFIFRPRRRVEPRYVYPDEIERRPRAERRIKRRRPAREAARPDRPARAAAVPRAGSGAQRDDEPEAQPVEKAADAKTILVVGDFLGSGLAEGLETAYADNANVQVVDRANGSSGFVRDDFYDWPGELAGIIEEVDPDIIAVMIGSNDRQPLRVDGSSHEELTPAWTTEYESRVEEFAEILKSSGKPFIWVGMPPFKSSSMSSDMLAFNDLYRQAAEAAGGQFVDIWDGFVDESGSFSATGPDINGQPARLRGSDGINMTRQGRRKIAFYAEKPLSRLLDPGQAQEAPAVGALPGGAVPEQPAGPVDRTLPVALGGPELDGGNELLGADHGRRAAVDSGRSVGERLIEQGMVPEASAGRADDFRVGRPAGAQEPQQTQQPAAQAPRTPRADDAPADTAREPAAPSAASNEELVR